LRHLSGRSCDVPPTARPWHSIKSQRGCPSRLRFRHLHCAARCASPAWATLAAPAGSPTLMREPSCATCPDGLSKGWFTLWAGSRASLSSLLAQALCLSGNAGLGFGDEGVAQGAKASDLYLNHIGCLQIW
jgi:hypothetical protein